MNQINKETAILQLEDAVEGVKYAWELFEQLDGGATDSRRDVKLAQALEAIKDLEMAIVQDSYVVERGLEREMRLRELRED